MEKCLLGSELSLDVISTGEMFVFLLARRVTGVCWVTGITSLCILSGVESSSEDSIEDRQDDDESLSRFLNINEVAKHVMWDEDPV